MELAQAPNGLCIQSTRHGQASASPTRSCKVDLLSQLRVLAAMACRIAYRDSIHVGSATASGMQVLVTVR